MSRLERFLFALMIALSCAGITLVVAQAHSQDIPAAQGRNDCAVCHSDFQEDWLTGAHGQASQDPVFTDAWTEQGKPGACLVCHVTGYDPATATWQKDGVACEACHSPAPLNHPEEPMPVDRTPDLCGRCHSDVRFGWEGWKISAHYQRGLTCSVCHDPHSASIKTIPDEMGKPQDLSALCINCHGEVAMQFPDSMHSQGGVTCVDCHLEHFGESMANATHTVPDHSFKASLGTCNACHEHQMHGPTEASGQTSGEPLTTTAVTATPTSDKPAPVSPAGFAGLAGLIGLAGGMVLSPWLEKAYRRMADGGKGHG